VVSIIDALLRQLLKHPHAYNDQVMSVKEEDITKPNQVRQNLTDIIEALGKQ
jgi:hypothetical protein